GLLEVDLALGDNLVEMAAHGHHPETLGRELDLRVHRVELPDSHGHLLFGRWFVAHGPTNRLEAPLISSRIEFPAAGVTLGAMIDPLVPGHRYASGAEELWALLVASFSGWEDRVNQSAEKAGLSP